MVYVYIDELRHHGVKGMKWGKHLTTAQLNQAVNDVYAGKYGNGADRKKNLGSHYDQIQQAVNAKKKAASNSSSSSSKTTSSSTKYDKSVKDAAKLAKEVRNGKYGNGEARKKALGTKYAYVQNMVNQQILGKKKAAAIAKQAGWNFNSSSKKTTKKKTTNTKKTNTKKNSSTKKATTSKK